MDKDKTKKPRKLRDLKIAEISFVDVPANLIPFYFAKRKDGVGSAFSLQVDSDGTASGTVIKLNGNVLENVDLMECRFSATDEKFPLTFSLLPVNKSSSEVNTEISNDYIGDCTMDELIELIKKFTDDLDINKAELSKEALNAIKGALNLLSKYQDDFPAEVTKAVGTLAKYAVAEKEEKKKGDNDDDDVKKAGAKLSKETASMLKSILDKLQGMGDAVESLKNLLKNREKMDSNNDADDDDKKKNKKVKKSDSDEEDTVTLTKTEFGEIVEQAVKDALDKE